MVFPAVASSGGSRRARVDTYRHHQRREIDIKKPHTTSIHSSLSALYASGKFSDMVIRCGGHEFKTHRAIVCTQSPFFNKALTGGFSVRVPVGLAESRGSAKLTL
jgi:hypothetical protein